MNDTTSKLFRPGVLEKIVSTAVNNALTANRVRIDAEIEARAKAVAGRITDLNYPKDRNGDSFLLDIPPYHACSGGVRVLHYLAALLVEAGEAVAVTNLCYFNPLIPIRTTAIDSDILILPEAQRVNITGARRKCVWMLCYADKYFKGRIDKDTGVLVYQHEYLAGTKLVCDHPVSEDDIVFIPNIDPAWCFAGIKRIKNCLYGVEVANKKNVSVNPALSDAVMIPDVQAPFIDGSVKTFRESEYNHQRVLAILRASENFFTVDHNTAMRVEAQLCGCKIFYVQPDGSAAEQNFPPGQLSEHLMNPSRDVFSAVRFASRAKEFFRT